MASVFKLMNSNGTESYYGSVYIDGKRHRKKLSNSKDTAIKLLKQFEREMLIKPSFTPNPTISLIKAQIAFLKDMDSLGVEVGLMSISRSNCFNSFEAVSFELESFFRCRFPSMYTEA